MAMFMDDTGADFSMDTIDTPQSLRVESSVLVDLRGSPRVEVSFPAEVHMHDADNILVMITNISRTGLRAEGCRQMLIALFGNDVNLDGHKPVVARFFLEVLDADGSERTVVVRGRTVYIRPDNGRFQVGVEFIDIEEGGDVLFDYLASRGVRK